MIDRICLVQYRLILSITLFAMGIKLEMFEKLLPIITTLGGALIGALVAYLVARQQFKATVLSKNRQEWINKLRDLLAEYEAILFNVHADFKLSGNLREKDKGLSEMMRANLIRSQVKLLVNPKEDDHSALLELMLKLDDAATHGDDAHTKIFTTLDKEYIALAQNILKREWERVKKGN